ncbi:aspartokinase [Candidatus Levyibacteriota bacterium]|nr:aspartokinase [Candidatus Levybacteria bacterium]
MIKSERSIVGKFGGTSMATSDSIIQSGKIVNSEKMRAVVVSAPGKKNLDDIKVTDSLLRCSQLVNKGEPFEDVFSMVIEKFENIGRDLEMHNDTIRWLELTHKGIASGFGRDWIASRGENIMARIFSKYIDGFFYDAEDLIILNENRQVNNISYEIIKNKLEKQNIPYVIPGFYGKKFDGSILTFERGGSDITGAIIARGLEADEYQNWTDVDGVRAADPRLIHDAKSIHEMTFREMREMSYRGAGVLMMDAIIPVAEFEIPVIVKNTFNPSNDGTRIVAKRESNTEEIIIGIASRDGFVSIQIGKNGMNSEKGIAGKILECFEENDVSVEHDPTGIDMMSVISHKDQLNGKTDKIINRIKEMVCPDEINVINNIGLVCIVGQNISKKSSFILSKMSSHLLKKGIEISSITYPTEGNSMIIGFNNNNIKEAVIAIYDALIRN